MPVSSAATAGAVTDVSRWNGSVGIFALGQPVEAAGNSFEAGAIPPRISLYEIRVARRLLCRLRRLVRRADIGADHARFEFVNGHNVGCREREYSQCGQMDIGRR
jgi:hypothetical protein